MPMTDRAQFIEEICSISSSHYLQICTLSQECSTGIEFGERGHCFIHECNFQAVCCLKYILENEASWVTRSIITFNLRNSLKFKNWEKLTKFSLMFIKFVLIFSLFGHVISALTRIFGKLSK